MGGPPSSSSTKPKPLSVTTLTIFPVAIAVSLLPVCQLPLGGLPRISHHIDDGEGVEALPCRVATGMSIAFHRNLGFFAQAQSDSGGMPVEGGQVVMSSPLTLHMSGKPSPS